MMYIDGVKEETKQENAIELERIQKEADAWGYSELAYKGPTNDIDLSLEWYCPRCADGTKLRSNSLIGKAPIRDVLYCHKDSNECEYSFCNRGHRGTGWWSKGYSLPLSPKRYKEHQLASFDLKIKTARMLIKRNKEAIKQFKLDKEALEKQ